MSSEQLPLRLALSAAPGFAEFHPASAPVVQALQHWSATAPQADASILLIGALATGKSHLLLAACADAEKNGVRLAYLPLSALAGHAAEVLAAQPALEALAIDDLDQAEGNRELQLALFNLHNRQRDAGGRLLYAARRPPQDWTDPLPDLVSRLSQSTRFTLTPLDEAGRRQWLVDRAHQRGFALDEAAVEYIFRRSGRDFASLNQLLDRLDHASLAEQRRITLPFLRRWIDG